MRVNGSAIMNGAQGAGMIISSQRLKRLGFTNVALREAFAQ